MVKSYTEQFLKDLRTMLRNPIGLLPSTPPRTIIGVSPEMLAMKHSKWYLTKNYRRVLSGVPGIKEDKEKRKTLRSKKAQKKFERTLKCRPEDLFKYGLEALGKQVFDKKIRDRYNRQIKKQAPKYAKLKEKYDVNMEDWQMKYDTLKNEGIMPFTILSIIGTKPILPIEVKEDFESFDYLSSILSYYDVDIDINFFDNLKKEPDFNVHRKLSTCLDTTFHDVKQDHPKLAKKMIDNTLVKPRKRKKKEQ